MTIKALLFDMDYTLLDREVAVTTFSRIQFSRYADSSHVEAMVQRFRARDLQGFDRRHEVYSDIEQRFNCSLPVDELVEEFERDAWGHTELYPGVDLMLSELKDRGKALGIITNGSNRVQSLKIENVGLRSKVDSIAIAGELDMWKPLPEVFFHICQNLNVTPDDCLYIGDTPIDDVFAAHCVGMKTVWCRGSLEWPSDTPRIYDFAIDTVTDVLNLPINL